MTIVHSSTPSALGRSDEGAALQRRLMQDLERQWLDNWTVADQLQAQAAPAPTPAPEEQPQAGAQDLTKSLPPAPTGISSGAGVQRTPPATQAAQGGGSRAPSGESGAPTSPVAFVAVHQMATSAASENQVAATPGSPQSSRDTPPPSRTDSNNRPEARSTLAGDGLAAAQQAAPSAASVQPSNAPLPQSPLPLRTVETAADFVERSIATQVNTAAPATVGGKAQTMGLTPGMAQATSSSESSEKEAASASRQSAKAPHEEADAGPRRLMLRETDDRSVLASVRDTDLTSSQSRLAADGLARALMEAGYARVQVVVNGHQHRNERNEAGTTTTPRSSPNGQPQSTPTTPQERLHGR